MADVYVPQPVQTLNNGDVVAKIADGTVGSQLLAIDSSGRPTIKLNDGAGNSITEGQKTMASSLPVVIASDQTAVSVTATNLPTTVDTNFGTVGASTLRSAAEIGNATGAADFNYGTVGAQTLRVASQVGNATGAADYNNGATGAQTLRTAANLAVAGANVSNSNPVPVVFATGSAGTYVNKYNTTVNLAVNANVNHDYTVTASKTITVRKFWATASGKIRIDCQTSPDGTTFTTFWTGMSSPSDPNISIDLDTLAIQDSGTGAKVRIVITNEDNKVFDVFSTISGIEV